MFDTIGKVQCSDCKSVVSYSFALVAHDGQQSTLMLLASCPNCRKAGDERSLRKFEKVDKNTLTEALERKLPIVLLR